MSSRVRIAVVSMHISAAGFLLAALVMVELAARALEQPGADSGSDFVPVLALAMAAMAGLAEVVAFGLRGRKSWAWLAGLILFGLYVPTVFLPIGVAGLWALLPVASQQEFGGQGA